MQEYDVAVIGGGPGGYTAAIRVAQLGGKVVLIEKNKLGGVCNNYGCIPSKTMINLAEIQSSVKIAETFGIKLSRTGFDMSTLVAKRTEMVEKLAKGVEFLIKSNGIKLLFGNAVIKSKNEIIVAAKGNTEIIKCKKIIIATGSRSIKPKLFENSKNVMTSEEFLYYNELPSNLIIIGGGPEGIEFATMLSNFGSKVTLIEMLDRLLPQEDNDVSSKIEQYLRDSNVSVLTNTKVTEIVDENSRTKIKTSNGKIIDTDKIILSTGRKANTENIGLENLSVKLDDTGRIIVSKRMETSVKGIYAIGDVAGGRYAHEAMQNGTVAAENSMNFHSSMEGQIIPRCVYAIPEIACVGIREEDIKKGNEILIGKVTLKSSGRAMTMSDTNGFVKVIIDKKKRKILGVHMINERASDMIGECVLTMKYLKTDDIINAVHPHPTLSESIREAVLDAYGIPIHSISKNRTVPSKSLKHYAG